MTYCPLHASCLRPEMTEGLLEGSMFVKFKQNLNEIINDH